VNSACTRVPSRLEVRVTLTTMLQTSAAGVLALLSEPESILRQHALKALLPLVSQFWAEISEHITAMCVNYIPCYRVVSDTQGFRETLYESDGLPKESRDSAALLASKIYYYLGEYDEALSFALGAGPAFEAESRAQGSEEYVETVVCEFQYPLMPPCFSCISE
jgi:26S proteasome regulatory subunit N2